MDNYAKGSETFDSYFTSQIGWFVVFCVFTFLSLVLLISR